jgi:hypothetical protein
MELKRLGGSQKKRGFVTAFRAKPLYSILALKITASTAMFNHAGDGVILTHHSEHTLRVMDYPSLTLRESPAAHVGGCVAVALDPRGRWILRLQNYLYNLTKLQISCLWWV